MVEGSENAVVNFLRVRQDVGSSSTVGAVYTDRTINSQDFNRVGGADARLVFSERYILTLLGAASWTDRGEELATEQGTYLSAAFNRTGREFNWSASLQDHAPDFTASSGFLRRTGDTQVNLSTSITRFGAGGSFLESWGPNFNVQGYWDHDTFWDGGGFKEGTGSLSSNFSFRNNINLWVTASLGRYDFPNESYDGLFVLGADDEATPFRPDQDQFGGLSGFNVFFFVRNWQKVSGNVRLSRAETPIFDRPFGVPVAVGDSWSGSVSLDLFPTPSIQGELRLTHSRIDRQSDGMWYSRATIPRIRLQYQFSPSLFVRTIAEYSAQESEGLIDPLTGLPLGTCDDEGCSARLRSEANDVHFEGLISYEPSPGTVFFIGYTREFEDSGAFDFQNVRPQADGLFVKLSYRFRM